jgi:hypothetical protein
VIYLIKIHHQKAEVKFILRSKKSPGGDIRKLGYTLFLKAFRVAAGVYLLIRKNTPPQVGNLFSGYKILFYIFLPVFVDLNNLV